MTAVLAPVAPFGPLATRRWPRWLAPLALASLLLLVIEGWSPPLRDTPTRAADGPEAGPATLDPAAVERATHVPTPVPGRAGVLEVAAPTYRAVFDASGVSYAPEGAAGPLELGLTTIERGGTALAVDPGPWAADANVAARDVAPGVTEQVTARDGEIEWDVVLAAPPRGSGDLRVTADLAGTDGPVTSSDGHLRLGLTGGGQVDMGEVVVLDAAGTELFRSLPRVDGGQVVLDVPAAALDGARYPVTVDPTLAPAQTVTEDDNAVRPSVAFDGNGYLVVWGSAGDIKGTRLNASGGVVVAGIPISNDNKPEFYPDVAWNGDSYFVVWQFLHAQGDWDIYGRRLTASGNLIGAPFAVNAPGAEQQLPSVAAATNSGFLVVWQDSKNTGSGSPLDIYGTWVSLNGVPTNPAQRLSFDTKTENDPDVTWNGEHFLVVWELFYGRNQNGTVDSDIRGQRVLTGPGGSAFGGGLAIATPTTLQASPSVASDGSRSLVVWHDNREGDIDIYGSVVDRAGVVSTNKAIANPIRTQLAPELAFNGSYLVSWIDDRRTQNRSEVFATRVDADGNPIDADTDGFIVVAASATYGVATPVVSRGAEDDWGVVYGSATSGNGAVQLTRVSPK